MRQTKHFLFVIGLFLLTASAAAQERTQTVSGVIVDKESNFPLVGVTVRVVNSDLGTTTDLDGRFIFEAVPVGRQQFSCSYIGYQDYTTEGIIVNAQRSEDIQITMQKGILMDGVEIVADGNTNAPINNLATVSARSFSVEETERMPAGVNDMGRMALSYPGVQQGSNDTENDIIVRGNSSVGILWRLEGMDIPNPNHFARPGTSGGGVTIFSAQLLSKSDFYTGGMPAEFGNALSGAFDIHFRKGNMLERQHRVRIGLLGIDVASEGPIKQGESSYLANYRYSTLGLLNEFGFELIGERVSNNFQDLSFNVTFKGNKPNTTWTVFGFGGISEEHYSPKPSLEREAGVANHWEDRFNDSSTGVLGTTYTKIIDEKSYLKNTTTLMTGFVGRTYDTLDVNNVRYRYNTQEYFDNRVSTAWTYWKEINPRLKLKTGTIWHGIQYRFLRETRARRSSSDVTQENLNLDLDGGGLSLSGQLYGLAQLVPHPKWNINVGLHSMWLAINNTGSLDPRLSAKYLHNERNTFGLAIGQHSQMLPLAAYFYEADGVRSNFELPFFKAWHYIASYTYVSPKFIKFNAEVYYQRLSNIPVRAEDIGDGYWMLNNQADFPAFDAVSEGGGENYGIDLAVEKFFSNKFYFLITGSFFESNSISASGEKFPTRYSTTWSSSYTLGKEFEFKSGAALQIGARLLYNGGYRYTPFDPVASEAEGRFVPLTNAHWTGQVTPYSRVDSRISYRYNKKRVSGSINLDIQNVTNKKNLNGVSYNAETNSLNFRNFDGGEFIPVLSFVFDF